MKTGKKRKLKKRYWLLAGLAIVLVIPVLLLYKPANFNPPEYGYDKQVSPYLTHELSPQLYNGLQRQKPFDLLVLQEGINDIITRSKWPKQAEGISFSPPEVLFVPDSIVLMGTAALKGVEFVVTIELCPRLDDDGLLNLQVAKVKVGAVNITPLARLIAKKMYEQRLASTDIDTNALGAKITAALLNDEPFEPVFEIDDKKVRIERITITQGKLTIRLRPASV